MLHEYDDPELNPIRLIPDHEVDPAPRFVAVWTGEEQFELRRWDRGEFAKPRCKAETFLRQRADSVEALILHIDLPYRVQPQVAHERVRRVVIQNWDQLIAG